MSFSCELKYGDEKLSLKLPENGRVKVLRPKEGAEALTGRGVTKALENPVKSEPFEKLFSAGDKVTIIISDITRYSGAEIFLSPMVEKLNSAGVKDSDITILTATGMHRGHTEEEQRKLTGGDIYDRVKIVDHDCHDKSFMAPSGHVYEGSDVLVNKLCVECDKLIVTGCVGYHYLAGFGGGRKAIMPGVASYSDIIRFHFLSLNPKGPGRHPKVRTGILEGNPMSQFSTEILRKVKPVFLLNTVIDHIGAVVDICTGHVEKAFEDGVLKVSKLSSVPISDFANVVVASCGGYPKDINFIQSHKTFDYASKALRPKGKFFFMAECRDSIGSSEFLDWFSCETRDEMERALRKNFQVNGQTALSMFIKSSRYETIILSKLDDDIVKTMGARPAESKEQFFKEAEDALKLAEVGYVIPEGGYTVPRVGL